MRRDPLHVAVLAYDGLCTFEFASMVELFGMNCPGLGEWYRLSIAGLETGVMRADGGLEVTAPYSLQILDRAGTIVIPGWRDVAGDVPCRLIRKLRRAHRDGARVVSACSGAFVLAAAGLLDGRRATTHWKFADQLRERYPAIEVDPDVLYVKDDNIITAAGSAAGLDMGLSIIRDDFGATVANDVARRLVIPPHRAGGQKQFVEMPSEELHHGIGDHTLARALDRIRSRLHHEHSVESMANAASMSVRTFIRRFKESTGTTPHRWLQRERVQLAQSLLETTGRTLEQIALKTGFGDVQLLRLHFKREVGTTPGAYRRTFRAAKAG